MIPSSNLRIDFKYYLLLVIPILVVYLQVLGHEFISMDTPKYIELNEYVKKGLSIEGIVWAFTTFYFANWHPITWLSHMLDVSMFGLSPSMHHLMNVMIHALNTILVFQLLNKITNRKTISSFVACVFAIHPMHVESVAWVAERKDLLSAFFFFISASFYINYCRSKSMLNYAASILFAAFSLMSKPMLVTLPFVYLLFDFWPLQRIPKDVGLKKSLLIDVGKLILEKIPFFVLAILSSIITIKAQVGYGADQAGISLTLLERMANASVAYSYYLFNAIYPTKLAIFYPHPGTWPTLKIILSGLVIISCSLLVLYKVKNKPYLFVGWFFFVGTLIPVIGLFQVGAQFSADRYTYIPYIGLYIFFAYACADLFEVLKLSRNILFLLAITIVVFYSYGAYQYVGKWKDSGTIWLQTLQSTDPYYPEILREPQGSQLREGQLKGLRKAYLSYGHSLEKKGDYKKAAQHFYEAILRDPSYAPSHYFLGHALSKAGQSEDAVKFLENAALLDPEKRDQITKEIEMMKSTMQ